MRLYNLDRLADLYQAEDPGLTREEALERATVLRREFHRLDRAWSRSQERFHRHHVLVAQVDGLAAC